MNNASNSPIDLPESTQTNAFVGESFRREALQEPQVETIEETVGYAPPPPASHAGQRTTAQAEAEAESEALEAQAQADQGAG